MHERKDYLNKREQRLADLEISKKLQQPNGCKVKKYLSTEEQIMPEKHGRNIKLWMWLLNPLLRPQKDRRECLRVPFS